MFNLIDQGFRHQIGSALEPGRVVIKTVINDDDVIESTRALRQAAAIRTGDRTPLAPDGAEAIYAFQIEPTLWSRFKRQHPDIYAGLTSREQVLRERAAATLAAMRPQWVTCAPTVRPLTKMVALNG